MGLSGFPKHGIALKGGVKDPVASSPSASVLGFAWVRSTPTATKLQGRPLITFELGEESEKFLVENGKKEGVKTMESGLQYKVLKESDGITPKQEDFVTVHYRGTFIDGKEFDSSYVKGAPQTVQTEGVIKGWTEVLQMMKIGSKWEVFVPPHLVYDRGGLGGKIPPNKVLVFEIELLAIKKKKEA